MVHAHGFQVGDIVVFYNRQFLQFFFSGREVVAQQSAHRGGRILAYISAINAHIGFFFHVCFVGGIAIEGAQKWVKFFAG